MSECIPSLHKSYADCVLLESVGCKQCKKQYVQLNFRQRYCTDCKRLRLSAQQKASREKRKKAAMQAEVYA